MSPTLRATSHTRLRAPWPLHFKHSRWWKRWSWSKFASDYTWGINRVCECKMDVKSTWTPTWHWMDHVSWSFGLFQKPPLGGRLNTKSGDHSTLNAHKCWFILYYHVWGPAWIETHWISIWLGAQSHMASHYTWGSVTTHTTWCWDGLWTLSFGLSQFYGHNSWLMCEVALNVKLTFFCHSKKKKPFINHNVARVIIY